MVENRRMIEYALARVKRSVELIEQSKEIVITSKELIRETREACGHSEAILSVANKQPV